MYTPYAIIAIAGLLSLRFGRSRVVFILLVIVLVYVGYSRYLRDGQNDFPAKVIFHAMSILLPLNLLIFVTLKERGLLSSSGLLRLTFILSQLVVIAWIVSTNNKGILSFATQELIPMRYFPAIKVSQFAFIIMTTSFILMGVSMLFRNSLIKSGLLGALIAFFFASNFIERENNFPVFISVACLIMTICLIQDSHNKAYVDDLTGLLSRRALNERMLMLGQHYAIAMLDVDHFKKFNDTYGHDMGDQVLKMVGSKIRMVRGGGKVYRYGGEEFTIIFPRKDIKRITPYLEELRQAIANYGITIRGKDRPAQGRQGKKQRGKKTVGGKTFVSISIGVAEKSNSLKTPDDVIRAADKALYKAKKMGRNRIST